MPVGSCRYGFILNEAGGILDDLIVYRIKDKSWMIVVNAATIAGDEKHFLKNLSGAHSFNNVSDKLGKLDVQMTSAYLAVSECARRQKLFMRDAAYVISVRRVVEACRERGWI